MKKIKILFLMPIFSSGGSERTLINIIKSLSPEQFEIYIYVLFNKGVNINEIPPYVKIFAQHKFFKQKKLRYAFIELPFIILRIRPHLVFSSIFSMNVLAVFNRFILFFLNIKYILRQPERIREDKLQINYAVKIFYKFIYSSSHGNIALSEGVKNEMCRIINIHSEKVKRIYNPVDFESITLKKNISQNPVDAFLKKENLLISVGRFSKEKNHIELLKALSCLKQRYNIVANLMLLGAGSLQTEIQNFVQQNNLQEQVKFYGFLANPYYFISKADILVMTSLREGFGHVIVEAMACETFVISSDCEYGPQEIIRDGYNGRLYELGNVNNLTELLKLYLLNPGLKNDMIVAARQDAVKRFSLQKIVNEYEEFILKVYSPQLI